MKKDVILITGANGNVGKAAVSSFLAAGYYVIAIDSGRQPEETPATDYEFHSVDLRKEESVKELLDQLIHAHEQINSAILLAGGFAMGSLDETPISSIHHLVDLNFNTTYPIARLLHGHMLAKGNGRLVFFGARPAFEPKQGSKMVAYALSKSLLFRTAEIMNETAKGTNVSTTVVVPGTIDTPQNRKDMPNANFSDWVDTKDLAQVLQFICGSQSKILREPILKVYNNS